MKIKLKNKVVNFTKKIDTFFVVLSHLNYISLMKISSLVIGNSSSGVLETPSLGIPTINIGNRQKGRLFLIIYSILNMKKLFLKNINKALNLIKKLLKLVVHFTKGNTPKKIANKNYFL